MKRHLILLFVLALASIGMYAQNNALQFDGVNDCVQVGNMGALMGTTYTVETWIYPTMAGTGGGEIPTYGRTILASTNPSPTYGYPLWLTYYGDEIAVWAFESTAARNVSRTTTNANIPLNTWTHIALSVVKGGATKLYVNGSLVLQFNNDGEGSWGTQFTLGDLRPNRLIPYGGLIDEVRLWNDVRTDSEILQNMDNVVSPTEQGLVGYWKLDESSGNIAYNDANSNFNGTVLNQSPILWVDGNPTLPVELSSFTVTITSELFVRLRWITQSETEMSGYYVLRNDKNDLSSAIVVSPLLEAENSSGQTHYEFVDDEVSFGTWYYWLQGIELNGGESYHGPISATVSQYGVQTPPPVEVYSFIRNTFPNPFSTSITCDVNIAKYTNVDLDVFNIRGQQVRSLKSGSTDPGSLFITWDGKDEAGRICPAGVYFLRLQTDEGISYKKVQFIK